MRAAPTAFALSLALARAAAAHDLAEGTARVTLRDDHLDVAAEWDLFPLADADPTALATGPDATVAEARARLFARVERETRLRVDGAPVDLAVTAGPSSEELRALAATVSASGERHGGRARFRLEARRPVHGARRVTLSPPAALGPVLVSFVQPASRYTRPGDVASFDVLAPRAAPEADAAPPPATTRGSTPWRAAVITLTAFAALAAWRWPALARPEGSKP
ncbi:MAG: hypothetical protein U0324_15780 [Polyangiales bacterium]